MAKTSRESFKFMLRLPDELRDQLRAAADGTGRSVTGEIIARLEETFGRTEEGVRPVWLTPELWARVEREANAAEVVPNDIVFEAVEKSLLLKSSVADKLRALSMDVVRRKMENTPEGREILETVQRLIDNQDRPKRPWNKDR